MPSLKLEIWGVYWATCTCIISGLENLTGRGKMAAWIDQYQTKYISELEPLPGIKRSLYTDKRVNYLRRYKNINVYVFMYVYHQKIKLVEIQGKYTNPQL